MRLLAILGLCFLSACAAIPPASKPEVVVPEAGKPTQAEVLAPPAESPAQALQLADWSEISAWGEGEQIHAWEAFQHSCSTLKRQAAWASVCEAASFISAQPDLVRRFFENHFLPYRVTNPDKSRLGMITGYYEPLLNGSRTRTSRFRYPIYGPPSDLLTIDLASVYPELKGMRLRGRLQGNKIVPYYNRAEIESGAAPVRGAELYWVDDAVDLFFLQIQGSGKIRLPGGELVRIGYADQNGFPYKSVGKVLVERGELTLDKASMQGIKDWAKRNPNKLNELLNANASYVFFRELPSQLSGPLGALGVPLTEGRSLAVDPRSIPLGAPVFLMTTWPNENRSLNRLMMAQDTGGAIKGAVRADFFWGFGPEAGKLAGSMKQNGRMWVLLPKGYVF
ncbi:MAG: murein transglycosylase A [Sulfuricellaceae bacterium]|nr:murein transglycosylase A [Sulfuricellaceae bacterium]